MNNLQVRYIAHHPFGKYIKNIFTPEEVCSHYPEIEIVCRAKEIKTLITKQKIKIYIGNELLTKELTYNLIRDVLRTYDDRYRKIEIRPQNR